MAIITPAYLEFICEGYLAQIVFPDGNKSQILGTKKQVFEVAESFFEISLSKEEILAIKEQASKSHMLEDNPSLEKIVNDMSIAKHKLEEIQKAIAQIKKSDSEGEEWKN
jgi:hypothetical protein